MPNGHEPNKAPPTPGPGSGSGTGPGTPPGGKITEGGSNEPPQSKKVVAVAAAVGGLVGGVVGALIGSGMHH